MSTRPQVKAVVMAGGGFDSTALLHYVAKQHSSPREVVAFHVHYGQRAVLREQQSVYLFAKKLGTRYKTWKVLLPSEYTSQSAIMNDSDPRVTTNVLPYRNALLMTFGLAFARNVGCSDVFVAFHQEPEATAFADADKPFLDSMNDVAMAVTQSPLKVFHAPFASWSRQDIFNYGMANVPYFELAHTCYDNLRFGCGECAHCKQAAVMRANYALGLNNELPRNK